MRLLPLVALAAALAGCSLFDSSSAPGEGGKTDPVAPRDKAAKLFAEGRVPRFEFTVSDSAWEWLNAHATEEIYVPARLKVDSADVGEVGLRYKGSYGSLFNCFQGGKNVCGRMSFKVDFDRYDSTIRLNGLKKLNLHSLRGDESLLRDRLSYRMFRESGIHAPRASHAMVSVNGGAFGLYGMIEAIDGRFTKSRWKDDDGGDGNLYKEAWPREERTDYSSALETNEGAPTEGMLEFARDVAEADRTGDRTLFERHVDPAEALDYLAVDVAIDNVDGYRTFYCGKSPRGPGDCSPHNFYWYQRADTALFSLVPWDHNATFLVSPWLADLPEWNDASVSCAKPERTGANTLWFAGCYPWFRVLRNLYAREWVEAMERLLEGALADGVAEAWIDAWASEIEPFVREDTLYSETGWRTAVEQLKSVVKVQRWKMVRRLEGLPPEVPKIRHDAVNGFEDVAGIFAEAVAEPGMNRSSALRSSIDEEGPVSGSRSLRLEWDYESERDSAGAQVPWSAWGGWTLGWKGGAQDLRNAKFLAMRVVSSSYRTFNVDFLSPKYAEGVYKYWGAEIMLSEGTTEVRFPIDSVSLRYGWAGQNPAADGQPAFGEIMGTCSGLYLYPAKLGLDGSGVFAEGAGDVGWVLIDDLRLEW
ncbi:MAG: CotH kinase family protein [Fibrobacterales bacterium]|nr:CotH kinase family protein [Fibrobacterales bacterium]